MLEIKTYLENMERGLWKMEKSYVLVDKLKDEIIRKEPILK